MQKNLFIHQTERRRLWFADFRPEPAPEPAPQPADAAPAAATGTILAQPTCARRPTLVFMKHFLIRLLAIAWFSFLATGTGYAQQPDNLAPIGAALRHGSSRELAQYLAPSVEVGFSGQKENYNAAQAELVIRDFFAKSAPSAFDFIHQGASPQGIQYAIGRYTSRGGVYRVYIKLKPDKGSPIVDTLDFTKE